VVLSNGPLAGQDVRFLAMNKMDAHEFINKIWNAVALH